jgi:PLP dependent protein
VNLQSMILDVNEMRECEEMKERLDEINDRIDKAATRAGRNPSGIKLVAVSKTYSADRIQQVFNAGQIVFGESRVQEAASKVNALPEKIQWHLIGHLQSNKAKLAVRLFSVIHSVDSVKLLKEINRVAAGLNKIQPVLLQVNISQEDSKFGISLAELPGLIDVAAGLNHIHMLGLMTIPPFSPNPENSRVFFERLKQIAFEELIVKRYVMEEKLELSMGMSHDFQVAIEEGATMVRIGTAIFGARTSC